MNEPDHSIIEQIRNGETRKYAVLVDRYKRRGLALALRILRDQEEAEEATQDAFLRAFRGLDGFRGESSFGTWFYRILYNLCISRTRRGRPKNVSIGSLDDDAIEEGILADESADLTLAIEGQDIRDHVLIELDRLPDNYRIALTLFYLQELSYEEIASMMKVPIGTVKTNLHRARSRLKDRVIVALSMEGLPV